jgi:diaminohydroxyphosphoribosylaminopyrimidine deaminase / 5-amino-6-(5-phosphoribosylamino)uracil reductase
MNSDQIYMQRCLDLAMNGLGQVAPNPMVGCVIVYQDRIIGEGFHKICGGPHAEVNAIASVNNKDLLSESVLYVNLEPCAHHGKTPPCTSLILESGIKKVIVASEDPFPEVSGRGFEILRNAGCEVISGVLSEKSRRLNKRFFTFHEKKRPYIILKWAQTSDGYIDIVRGPEAEARPTWITSEKLRLLVHKWRTEEPAIMTGTNTALLDNPRLNVRDWYGKQPVRIILDRSCRLPGSLNIFDNSQQTIIFNALQNVTINMNQWIKIPFDDSVLLQITNVLYEMNIQSVFVEGGRQLLQSFIDQNLWDEARVFVGKQTFGKGCHAPMIHNISPSTIKMGDENFLFYDNMDY